MSTIIYIQNQTTTTFNLNDIDGHFYGQITGQNTLELVLPFSETFQKPYILTSTNGTSPGTTVGFAIGINGDLVQTNTQSGLVNLRITSLKAEPLPLTITRNNIGNVLLVQQLTQPTWVPRNTLLIIFAASQANPQPNFPLPHVPYHIKPLF